MTIAERTAIKTTTAESTFAEDAKQQSPATADNRERAAHRDRERQIQLTSDIHHNVI